MVHLSPIDGAKDKDKDVVIKNKAVKTLTSFGKSENLFLPALKLNHHAEYRIPEPTENPVAAIVMYYKAVKKQVPFDDREWDKIHWARNMKAAKKILRVCESYEASRACIDEVLTPDDEYRADWTLETVLKRAHGWKLKQGKRLWTHQ